MNKYPTPKNVTKTQKQAIADELFNLEIEELMDKAEPSWHICEWVAELEGSDPHDIYNEMLDRVI